jgi:hypothetical protein
MMEPKPYVKSLDDELDWKFLDQLYGVVSQISNFCFETKKFCVTTQFIVLTLFAKFTADKLDNSLFVAGATIPLCFWFLDAVAYYYQVKIRGTMESIRSRIKGRNSQPLITTIGPVVIEKTRLDGPTWRLILKAAVNHSMWMYAMLAALDGVAWMLFVSGSFH